jgi:hypothetical protein
VDELESWVPRLEEVNMYGSETEARITAEKRLLDTLDLF